MRIAWMVVAGLLAGCDAPVPGWTAVCAHAPYRAWRAPPRAVAQGLAAEGMVVGARGWTPTAAWVNEQCRVLHPAQRRPNRHGRR